MEFFHKKENVDQYLQLAEGYDGQELIDVLKKYLKPLSTVLELGMGPGKDLDILSKTYTSTGSDYSDIFLNMYREKHPDADLLLLDARKLDANRKWDCIYSNKVLMHLQREDMKKSLIKQKDLLNDGGLLFHSFWKGDREETMQGVHFVYYEVKHLLEMVNDHYDVLETTIYSEMEDNDSIYIVLRKKR